MTNADDPQLVNQIHAWHESEEHQKIIEAIERIPQNEWNYQLIGLYARALNNTEQYEAALAQLLATEEQGKRDGIWHYRTGYSLYFLDRELDAAEHLRQAIELGEDGEDAKAMLALCMEAAQSRQEHEQCNPIVYSEEELNSIEAHIEKYFGKYKNVFHEISSPDIHVDIAIIEPDKGRNYYTLITTGMGAHTMNVPESLKDANMDRAELLVCLPPDWQLDDLEKEEWYWPIRWLKILSRLPIEEDTWLGWGHTIPSDGPFAPNTRFAAILLLNPGAFNRKSFECRLPGGEIVNFYQMIPLYQEETEFKIKNNTELLLNFLDSECLEYIHPNRQNVCGE